MSLRLNVCSSWQCLRGMKVVSAIALAFIHIALFSSPALSVETFPTEIPKTKGDLAVMIKAILQKDAAFLKSFKTSATTASATMKIKNKEVTLVAFKRPGVPKVLLAIVPQEFELSTFVPIPSGTPVDGVTFDNVALVYVPTGAGRSDVTVSGLPAALTKSFAGHGMKVDFKDGLNVFGKADFQSAGAIKKLLSAMGHNQFDVPLGGSFSPDILRYDLKTASQTLKEELLTGLHLNLPLPKKNIPGMPSAVTMESAHLAIVGKEVKGKRKIFAGITGEIKVKLGNKSNSFGFGVLTGDKVTLTATSKDTVTLPLFSSLALTNMSLTATKTSGKWSTAVTADSKLFNKVVDISVDIPASGTSTTTVLTKMTLAEMIGDSSLPGLDKVELDSIEVQSKFIRVGMTLDGIGTSLDIFKISGSSKFHVSAAFDDFSATKLIPGSSKTPFKDATFKGLNLVYNPEKSAKTVPLKDLGSDIAARLHAHKSPITLKPGVNLFGHLDVHPNGEVAKLLSHVGVSNLDLPLTGAIDPRAFGSGTKSTSLKNTILDSLDINLGIGAITLPGISKVATVHKMDVAIKGINKGGKREVEIDASGTLDVKLNNKQTPFDFKVYLKPSGGKSYLELYAAEKPGRTIAIGMFTGYTLSNVTFGMDNSQGHWIWQINGGATIGSKNVNFVYINNPIYGRYINVYGGALTLADVIGSPGLPGLDDVAFETLEIGQDGITAGMKVNGIASQLAVFKKSGSKKHFVSWVPTAKAGQTSSIEPAKFIPGADKTPLKDVSLQSMAFVYNPETTAVTLDKATLATSVVRPIEAAKVDMKVQPGLNVFGHMDVHPSGEMASLLQKVGIHDLKIPLNGKFSKKAFSKNITGTAIKNEILDHLDLKVAVPKINLPGISKVASIHHTTLKIKGVKKGDKREVDVDLAGELDVKVGSETLVLDYDVELVKPQSGNAYISVKATEAKGKTFSVSMLKTFTISNIDFTMDNSQGHWRWYIQGDTKVGTKTASIYFNRNPPTADYMTVNTKLTLAEAIDSPGLPGLDDVEFDWMEIWKDRFNMGLKVKGISSQLAVFKQKGASKHFISWIPAPQGGTTSPIHPDQFIPGTANTPLKDVTFNEMAFIYNPEQAPFNLVAGSLPSGVEGTVSQSSSKMTTKPGLNVFGHMDVHPTGEVATLLNKVGITELSMPLNGQFSKKAFSENLSGTAIKNAILDKLDLSIKLPTPHIAEMSKFLTFKNGKLKVKGKLPDGSRGIDVAVSGDVDVKVKGDTVGFSIKVEEEKSGGTSSLVVKGSTDKPWNHPLGIDLLDLESLTLKVTKKKKATKNSSLDIKITANTDIGSHSKLKVTVDVKEKNGAVTDASFSLDGPLKLSDIPGVKDIPHSSHFTIDTIKITEHGIEAKTDFGGKSDLDIYLFTGSGWNFILRQDNLALTEFVPPLKNTPLKHIILSETALVVSKDGLTGPLSSFSPIAQDALKDIYGANAANINVSSGLSLITAFEQKKATGGLGAAFGRLGLSEEKVILMGDIGGLFGGPTILTLQVDLSAHTGAKKQPKWVKKKPGVTAVFSMTASEKDGAFAVEFGIGADITAKVHGTELLFDATTKLEFNEDGIGIKIVADLQDTKGWKKPFGIPGFTLYEVTMDVGIDEDGAVHLGFDGNVKISNDTISIRADADLLPEALGAPQDIAFKGSATTVDMFFIEEVALAMLGGNFSLGLPRGILPTYTNVNFAFVTPGAQDPDLHITGQGFALSGGMKWLGHEVGAMNVSVSPTKGISAKGAIDNLNLGPLVLKNNDFTLKAGLRSIPILKIDSDIELLGFTETFHVDFSKTGVSLAAHLGAGGAIDMTSTLDLTGLDLGAKHPDFTKADFSISGDFQLDVQKFIVDAATTALNDVYAELNAAFAAGQAAVATAQTHVNSLTTQINAERAKVRKEKEKAEARVTSAQNRVNHLASTISNEWTHYHHCSGWGKWPCKIKYGIEIGGTKAAKAIADEALTLAESLISHFPIDLDPRVAALIAARDSARVTLKLALDVIKGADALEGFLQSATNELTHNLGANIKLIKASFNGDIQGIIQHNTPVDLAIDAEFFGAEIKDKFAFHIQNIPGDLTKDVENLTLLGLYALHNLVEKGISDIPGPLKSKLKGSIASKFDGARAANKRKMAKYNLDFNEFNTTAETIQAEYTADSIAFLKANLSNAGSPMDSDTSETFTNELIEVGHSGLCLTNIGGLVKQHTCTSGADRKWSTSPVTGAPGVKTGLGYVNIIQTSTGDCVAPEGTWATVSKPFGDFTFPAQELQGNGKVSARACVNTQEFYWKILKHGDGWMQMANLATDKCLHFSNSNALPGVAQAVWKSCIGSANQVYRVASNATPVYHSANIALKNDGQSVCFSSPEANGDIKMVDCSSAARYDYVINIDGYIKFINKATGNCIQPASYANGAKLVEKKCSQLDYQWWNPIQVPGGWRIKNAQTQTCTRSPGPNTVAEVNTCKDTSMTVIAPVLDPNSGVTQKIKTASAGWSHYNAAKAGTANVGACGMNGMIGETWVAGTLGSDATCTAALSGRVFKNTGGQYYVAAVDGVEWVQSEGGKVPEYAIPSGFVEVGSQGGFKTSYTCRVNAKDFMARPATGVGWVIDLSPQPAKCTYGTSGVVSTRDFEVLSRQSSKSYKLDLGGLQSAGNTTATAAAPAAPKPATGWKRVAGSATDIGAGADGSIWAIGTANLLSGHGIWRRQGNSWTEIKSGGAVRIDVDHEGNAWVISKNNDIWKWNGSKWVQIPGKARDIGIGADGSVWGVGMEEKGNGYAVYRREGNSWVAVEGDGAVRIDVGPMGHAWVVQKNGDIYVWDDKWISVPGKASDISVGPGPSIVAIDPIGAPYQWSGTKWVRLGDGKGGTSVTVDAKGNPWTTNKYQNQIWAWGSE